MAKRLDPEVKVLRQFLKDSEKLARRARKELEKIAKKTAKSTVRKK